MRDRLCVIRVRCERGCYRSGILFTVSDIHQCPRPIALLKTPTVVHRRGGVGILWVGQIVRCVCVFLREINVLTGISGIERVGDVTRVEDGFVQGGVGPVEHEFGDLAFHTRLGEHLWLCVYTGM